MLIAPQSVNGRFRSEYTISALRSLLLPSYFLLFTYNLNIFIKTLFIYTAIFDIIFLFWSNMGKMPRREIWKNI